MSTARSRDAQSHVPAAPDDVTVVAWPVRDAALRFVLVLVVALIVALLTSWLSHSAAMTGVVLAVLLLALWRLWIPVTYQLDSRGVVQRVLGRSRHIDWLAVTRVQLHDRGMILRADRTDVPLAAIDAVFIPWRDKRAEMTAMVEYFVPHRVEPSDEMEN